MPARPSPLTQIPSPCIWLLSQGQPSLVCAFFARSRTQMRGDSDGQSAFCIRCNTPEKQLHPRKEHAAFTKFFLRTTTLRKADRPQTSTSSPFMASTRTRRILGVGEFPATARLVLGLQSTGCLIQTCFRRWSDKLGYLHATDQPSCFSSRQSR